jgi:hypothetical protein
VNKSQLIDALATRDDGNRKAAAQALESVLDTITREWQPQRPGTAGTSSGSLLHVPPLLGCTTRAVSTWAASLVPPSWTSRLSATSSRNRDRDVLVVAVVARSTDAIIRASGYQPPAARPPVTISCPACDPAHPVWA